MADEKPGDESEEEEIEEEGDSLKEVLIDGLLEGSESEEEEIIPDEEQEEEGEGEEEEQEETVTKADFEKLQESVDGFQDEVKILRRDKSNLNKALHEARQKKESKEDVALTDEQLLQILEDNESDPQTMFRIVKHLSEQAAKKASGDIMSDVDVKAKSKDADKLLSSMYPALSDESSGMRKAVDETKSYYGFDQHPLGDFVGTAINVLEALPNLISDAEKRGREEALKEKADGKRKEDIKSKVPPKKGKPGKPGSSLTQTQDETAKQLGLTPAQLKTYQKLVGNSATVTMKEA